jgi:tetratricopeptide (TPR) repeat protein
MTNKGFRQRAISILAEEIDRHRLAVFLGAGCSVAAGLPSWKQLIDELLVHYQIKTNETNLIRLASRLERDVGSLAFREKVCDKLRSRPDLSIALHNILVSLDIKLFVTTNYDHILEDAFRTQGYAPRIVYNDTDVPTIDPTRQTIVKLHGDIDSPSSLIITSIDYTRYLTKHPRFIEWFKNYVAQNTLLFLGTSFDDPRLKETDDHVLRLYDKKRRQPFIILKSPETDGKSSDQFSIDLEDFQALCAEFTERGFFVIPIDNYDEISLFLQDLQKIILKKKIIERTSDIESKLILQTDHINRLEQTASNLLDDITKRLCDDVKGNGRQPTPGVMIHRLEALIQHLEHPPNQLSPQAQMEGWITVVDSLLNAESKDHIVKARQYYEKAISFLQKIREPEKWQERLLRVRAKLQFFEGKPEEAIDSLMQSDDPKTISLRIALLLDSNRLAEANDFVSSHPINPTWVCTALYALIYSNQIIQAEDLFRQTMEEFESFQNQGILSNSPFEHESFAEKIHFVIAHALYIQALRLLGKSEATSIFPKDLVGEARTLCEKSLAYLDLFSHIPSHTLAENYFATQATLLTMQISFLLQKREKARDAARSLINVKPIKEEVVSYILNDAQKAFSLDDIKKVRMRLEADHPSESWAWLGIAIIEAYSLNNFEASWLALKKSLDLAISQKEKIAAAEVIFELSQDLDRLDEAMALIDDALPTDDLWHYFFRALFNFLNSDSKVAERLLAEIEVHNPPPELNGRIKLIYAKQAIKQEKWKDARHLLEEVCQDVDTPLALKDLLFVITKMQDDSEALKIAEEIESLGIIDWQVISVKAQAARNLGLYQKAAEAFHHLVDNFPEDPLYSYNLAEMHFHLNEKEKAIKFLEKYIQCDDKTNPNCLFLAASIYEIMGKYETAFELLDHCKAHITNHPNLLLQYLNLGYRTDNEQEANWALMRLDVLRQEGKVPEETFSRVSTEKLIEMVKEQRESLDEINNSYRLGQIPRILVCARKNIPIYLDWAVRTQKLQLSNDPNQWIDFTIYATNSLRVEFNKKKGNQLTIIMAPSDDEIVIDYYALITLHRLDLLKNLQKRYSKIYCPRILKELMLAELRRFGHHQLSEEKAFRSLNDKLLTGQIREFTAPEPPNETVRRQDSLTKRNLRLAQLEKFPLIDSYIEDSELGDFSDVRVVRLSQVVSWLYSKGKLSQRRFSELKNLSAGDRDPINRNINAFLDDAPRLLFGEITIKVAEKYGLLPLLQEVGCQVVVERATANIFRFAVREIDFGQEVGKWNKDLINSINKLKVIQEVSPQIPAKHKKALRDEYLEAATASLMYAEEAGLALLTDDRFTQMIRSRKLVKGQFGTDALLTDLYEREIITLSEYANCFIQLCKWRYRFLIPDARIMVFVAKEFKQRPPGKQLQIISDYGRSCMEDPGLFLGPEPTDPPISCGFKFQQEWVSRWIDFLVAAWQDDDFSVEYLKDLTQWVYRQALPDVPKHLNVEARERLASFNATVIIKKLLISIFGGKNDPLKLHGLFQQTFSVFGYDKKRINSEITAQLKFLQEFISNEKIKNKKKELAVRKAYYIRTLQAFQGKDLSNLEIDPAWIPILTEAGLLTEKKIVDDYDLTDLLEEQPDLISRENLPQYSSRGPLILIPPTREKPGTILILHELIKAPTIEIRIEAFRSLMKQENLSPFTKEFLEQRKEDLFSGNTQVWLPAAMEISDVLLNDYYYARSLFLEVDGLPVPDEDLINLAWKQILKPGLDSILDKMPILIDGDLYVDAIKERISTGIISRFDHKSDAIKDNLRSMIEWYLDNIYFIPVAPPLNLSQIIIDYFKINDRKEAVNDNLSVSLKGPSSTEILEVITDWIYKSGDPLAYMIAIELVLIARKNAFPDEEYRFIGNKFVNLINELMQVLLIKEEGDVKRIADPTLQKMQTVWQTRLMLNKYYLKYIDLHDKRNTPEEKRVALAWWLSKEAISLLLRSLGQRPGPDQSKIDWLVNEIQTIIKREDNLLSITHLFINQTEKYSLSRYYTLHSHLILPTVAIALLDPKNPIFMGLMRPSRLLTPDTRDLIINRIRIATLSGGQLIQQDENGLPLLWNIPLCVSGPRFLRFYYGDAIEFLGQEKISVIELAENVSRPNFLAENLPRLPEYIENNQLSNIAITLSLLNDNIIMNNEVPFEAKIFSEDKSLARKIATLGDELPGFFLRTMALILSRLQTAGNIHWSNIFYQQFNQLDYTKYSDEVIKIVIPELVGVVLLGGNYSILKPILVCKNSDKRIRQILGEMKEWLVYAFPRVPDAYRENVRKILNDLEDIPLPERAGEEMRLRSEE